LGIFLRRSSLDDLWNVLKRNLSFVGPCPLLIEYLNRYTPEQGRRRLLNPGLRRHELVSFIDDDRLTGTMK
jgi:sugar transferase EpsL